MLTEPQLTYRGTANRLFLLFGLLGTRGAWMAPAGEQAMTHSENRTVATNEPSRLLVEAQ